MVPPCSLRLTPAKRLGVNSLPQKFEERRVRGADCSAAKLADPPVNAKRRERLLRAFRVSCLSRKGLRRFRRGPRRSLFRERPTRLRKEPSRFLPHPRISVTKSLSLSPAGWKKSTSRFLSGPDLGICKVGRGGQRAAPQFDLASLRSRVRTPKVAETGDASSAAKLS